MTAAYAFAALGVVDLLAAVVIGCCMWCRPSDPRIDAYCSAVDEDLTRRERAAQTERARQRAARCYPTGGRL